MWKMNAKSQVKKRNIFQEMLSLIVANRLDKLDIQINGNRPWDIQVHSDEFFFKIAKFALGFDRLAAGESYMDGEWSCEDMVSFFEKTFKSNDAFRTRSTLISNICRSLPLLLFNMQTKSNSEQDIASHYDIGNDLFKTMLDRTMNYSCGYWQKNVSLLPAKMNNNSPEFELKKNILCETLDEAQMNKMLLIGRKLHLRPGMRVLDIGCGWGYLAKFLAINFGVNVTGITISNEQYSWATSVDTELNQLEFLRILNPKQTGKFEFKLEDYRDLNEVYDRIVSVGMIEHVGKSNYFQFFDIASRCLTDDGLFLLQTIGLNYHKITQVDPWTNKYIFPGGMIPYHTQLINAFYGKFIIEDLHNFGFDYYRTLMAWHQNFLKSWPFLKNNYSERFKRMWTFYLLGAGACFKSRKLSLWQFVLSRKGFPGGYVSYR